MSQPGQPGQDVPDELLQLTAELFSSWYGQDLDFTDEARTLLAAVLPAHEAMVRAKVAEEIRTYWRSSGGSPVWGEALAEAAEIAEGQPGACCDHHKARGTS